VSAHIWWTKNHKRFWIQRLKVWMRGKVLLNRTAVLNSVSFRDVLQLSSSFNNLDFKIRYQYIQRKVKD